MLQKIEEYNDGVNLSGYHYVNDDGLLHGASVGYNNRNKKFLETIFKNDLRYGLCQTWAYKRRFAIDTWKNNFINGVQIKFINF